MFPVEADGLCDVKKLPLLGNLIPKSFLIISKWRRKEKDH
jgi:hypothetical protein